MFLFYDINTFYDNYIRQLIGAVITFDQKVYWTEKVRSSKYSMSCHPYKLDSFSSTKHQ